MNLLIALLFLCHYFVEYGTAEHEKYIRTIHGYEDPPNGLQRTFIINAEDHHDGNIPQQNNPRAKREVPSTAENNQSSIIQKMNYLNDTHKQLMVHWVGEGSNVIICLARDPTPTLLPGMSQIGPSAVYISYDYGDTYENKTDLFKLPKDAGYATIEKFYNHPKYNTHFVFTDIKHNLLYVTTNHGRSIIRYELDFTPSDILFQEYHPFVFVVHDKNDSMQKLYLSQDFGASFTHIQDFVKTFSWLSENDSIINGQQLIIQRIEPSGLSTVLHSPPNPNRISTIYATDVNDFFIKGDYFFTTKRSTSKNLLELYVSTKLGKQYKCLFDTTLDIRNYFIVDVTSNRALVAVSHSDKVSHLYVSENLEPKSGNIKFKLSLEDVLCYFPNSTWHDSWLHHVSEDAFADVYKVEGLTGIYIASRLITKPNDMNLGPQHLGSVITFDHGRSWRLINAPEYDAEGGPIACSSLNNCSLHLSQKFGQLYPDTRAISILSSKSAPGILMATGVAGKSLKGHYGVYLSDDAGLTWRQTLRELYFFNMGDHGGILSAVKYFKSRGETRHIFYSTDEGENWQQSSFHDQDIRLYGLMTEPGENTTVFTMFGSLPQEHQWIIAKIDLIKAFKYNCTKNDYKTWSPSQMDENRSYVPCILGQQVTYERRMPHANCYNGLNYDSPISMSVCGCDVFDYECDFGFVRSNKNGNCVRNSSLYDPYKIPSSCKAGSYYYRTKGYRKIQGDVCTDGFKNHYQPEEIPCPFDEISDFLLFAQRERISRFNLVTKTMEDVPVKNLKNVIAIDFDMKHNCVYWADIAADNIGRQCLNGNSSEPEILVSSDLASIEGMALDWISNTLYFVDGMRAKIELIRTDINHSGRMRRTILGPQDLRKPRGIALHPKLGYMFWTDWSAENPSVNRANLDGSKIKRLFGRPKVEWPNGISIDYIAERIYWVDARQDYIASSDLHGDYFKLIISHEDVVSHPFAVAVFKNAMYWDDWKRNSIFSSDKDSFRGVEVLQKQLPGLMDLKVYAHGLQVGTNACSNSTCQYICVGGPKIGQKSCLCPDGMETINSKCMCPGGVAPYTNSTCPQIQNTCSPDHFTCSNSFCVPKGWRCDGEDDCGDGSDEKQCSTQTCPPSYFICGDGKCIPQYWKCDFDTDCTDGLDEANCPKANCSSDQFTCKNGKCIGLKWKCDGENDCHDGSDELNCARGEQLTCKDDEFKCKSGGVQCIPLSWRCDGENDCRDNSDETDCSNNTCYDTQFACGPPQNQCINSVYVCDGDKDCPDGRDEQNCTAIIPPPHSDPNNQFNPKNGTCQSWMFKCMNNKCIPYWWKCDGTDDCTDGSDELGCLSFSTPKPEPTTVKPIHTCPNNQFLCAPDGDCIFLSWVCDGMEDCKGGEDEMNCGGVVNCTKNQFKCRIDGSCIPMSVVCNNHIDCADGTDELICEHNLPSAPATPSCSIGYFPCDGNSCHPLAALCDGKLDCQDHYDEMSCSNASRVYQVLQMGVDERGINETSMLLFWWIPTQNRVKLEFMPSISRAGDESSWKNQSWTNITEYNFDNLQPFTRYNLTIYVRVVNTKTIFPPAKYFVAFTGEGVPSEPYNVTAKQQNGSHVLISWNKPTHPNGIIVNYQICFHPPQPEIQLKLSGNETAHLLAADFHSNIEYTFYVIAHNRKHESKRSNNAVLVFDGDSNLDEVKQLKVTAKNENSISLSWLYNKTVDGYNIEITAYPYPKIQPRVTNTTSVVIDGLAPGALYRFKVNAVKKLFVGASTFISERTDGVTLPEIRMNTDEAMVIKEVGTSVKLSWDRPKDSRKVAWTYGIYYGIYEEELFEKPRLKTENLTATVSNLQACEIYTFKIGLVGPLGFGPVSRSSYTAKTSENRLAPPKRLRVAADSQDMMKMRIEWQASCPVFNGSVSYVIRVFEVTQRLQFLIKKPNCQDLSHVFEVRYGAIYNISVRTDYVNAIFTENATYHAPPIMPPSGVNTFVHSNGSYIVYWQESKVPAGVGEFKYQVLVWQGSGAMDEAGAEKFVVEKPPFFYTNKTKDVHSFAVRLVTVDGYASLISSQVSLRAGDFGESAEMTGTSLSVILGLTALFVVACGVILFVVVKHRRLQNSFTRFANSHYNRRSGSATFDDNGLEEDDCPQIAGFSDDEPLVVA